MTTPETKSFRNAGEYFKVPQSFHSNRGTVEGVRGQDLDEKQSNGVQF